MTENFDNVPDWCASQAAEGICDDETPATIKRAANDGVALFVSIMRHAALIAKTQEPPVSKRTLRAREICEGVSGNPCGWFWPDDEHSTVFRAAYIALGEDKIDD